VTEIAGSEREIPADLVLLAIGFEGTDALAALDQVGLARSARGTVECGPSWQTDADGVFVAGDAHKGASLIVWAIAEGRAAAASADTWLTGNSMLPRPVTPTMVALR
jgi:glutamate synthase (NADPH/NADH) small chain